MPGDLGDPGIPRAEVSMGPLCFPSREKRATLESGFVAMGTGLGELAGEGAHPHPHTLSVNP